MKHEHTSEVERSSELKDVCSRQTQLMCETRELYKINMATHDRQMPHGQYTGEAADGAGASPEMPSDGAGGVAIYFDGDVEILYCKEPKGKAGKVPKECYCRDLQPGADRQRFGTRRACVAALGGATPQEQVKQGVSLAMVIDSWSRPARSAPQNAANVLQEWNRLEVEEEQAAKAAGQAGKAVVKVNAKSGEEEGTGASSEQQKAEEEKAEEETPSINRYRYAFYWPGDVNNTTRIVRITVLSDPQPAGGARLSSGNAVVEGERLPRGPDSGSSLYLLPPSATQATKKKSSSGGVGGSRKIKAGSPESVNGGGGGVSPGTFSPVTDLGLGGGGGVGADMQHQEKAHDDDFIDDDD